jgi:hypothetical protein
MSPEYALFTEILPLVQNFTADAAVNGITGATQEAYLSDLEKLGVAEFTQIWQNYYDKTKG